MAGEAVAVAGRRAEHLEEADVLLRGVCGPVDGSGLTWRLWAARKEPCGRASRSAALHRKHHEVAEADLGGEADDEAGDVRVPRAAASGPAGDGTVLGEWLRAKTSSGKTMHGAGSAAGT